MRNLIAEIFIDLAKSERENQTCRRYKARRFQNHK